MALQVSNCIILNEHNGILVQISLKFVLYQKSPDKKVNIGLAYGLAPQKWRAIIWTNDDLIVYWHMYRPQRVLQLSCSLFGLLICLYKMK